jgi:hypothetical protein
MPSPISASGWLFKKKSYMQERFNWKKNLDRRRKFSDLTDRGLCRNPYESRVAGAPMDLGCCCSWFDVDSGFYTEKRMIRDSEIDFSMCNTNMHDT